MHLKAGETDWREQIVLRSDVGPRVLTCACTNLPGEEDKPAGYVIVFDDITALLQAQRDAAWGEVARRLAHEIKNPLTPIQLSAERLRRKYLVNMPARRRSGTRSRDAHHRAAGRGDEGDGQRFPRLRPSTGHGIPAGGRR
jgi:nitrogen fixation/metabolism regulation signal transduction histidine kinase